MLCDLGNSRIRMEATNHYIARGAAMIGSVTIGDNVGIWFNAVVRGDDDHIETGANSNIQDGAVLHTDKGLPITTLPQLSRRERIAAEEFLRFALARRQSVGQQQP